MDLTAESDFMRRVCAVQVSLKAPKDQNNSFGGYKYRSCESILEAVKPLLKDNALVLTLSDSVEQIGTRFYIKATATLHDTASACRLDNSAYARECDSKKGMDDSQLTGACSSYARKYALCGLLAIDDNKDADTEEYSRSTQGTAAPSANKKKTAETPERPSHVAPPAVENAVLCADCNKIIADTQVGNSLINGAVIAAKTQKDTAVAFALNARARQTRRRENEKAII